MPVEILELIVKATITEEGKAASGKNKGRKDANEKERAITTSMEQVLEILKRKKER